MKRLLLFSLAAICSDTALVAGGFGMGALGGKDDTIFSLTVTNNSNKEASVSGIYGSYPFQSIVTDKVPAHTTKSLSFNKVSKGYFLKKITISVDNTIVKTFNVNAKAVARTEAVTI